MVNVLRFPENPLIRPQDLKPSESDFVVECVLNPGAFQYKGRIGLILRVAEKPQTDDRTAVAVFRNPGENVYQRLLVDRADPELDFSDPRVFTYKNRSYLSTISHLLVAWSDDGGRSFKPDYSLRIFPETSHETYGIEDCRVELIEGVYHLTFTAVSEFGVAGCHCSTRDWKTFSPRDLVMPPHNKDIAFFPRKIEGLYRCFHRPSGLGLGGNYIWLAESPDLRHWGNHRCIAATRPGMWDSERIGAGCAPIETPEGWLAIYHGSDGKTYRLGVLLLDLKNPEKVLARSEKPIMEPITGVETNGFYGNCIFTNGHVVEGDRILMYYGAADTVVCGAELSVCDLLASLR